MATREENIKKINDELEKLTDEELDDVAGGAYLCRIVKKSYDEKASAQQNQNNNQNNSTKNILHKIF